MLTPARASLKLTLFVLFPLLSSQAHADDFVMSNEEKHVFVGEPAPMPEATHDIGGAEEGSDPAANPAPQQTANAQPAKHQHPSPQLPAGWSSPDDVSITGNNGLLGTPSLANNGYADTSFGNGYGNSYGNNYGNNNYRSSGLNLGGVLSNFVGVGSSNTAYTQPTTSSSQQYVPAGNLAGIAGNLAVGNTSRNRTPVLPAGYTSPQQLGGGTGANGLAGFPSLPPALLGNGLAGLAAGENGEDGAAPATPQERAQMAAFLASLMQFVMSHPDSGLNLNTALGNNNGYVSAPAGYSSNATLRSQPVRGVASSNCGAAGLALAGCR